MRIVAAITHLEVAVVSNLSVVEQSAKLLAEVTGREPLLSRLLQVGDVVHDEGYLGLSIRFDQIHLGLVVEAAERAVVAWRGLGVIGMPVSDDVHHLPSQDSGKA
jgi:hypothetical protein